MPFACAMPTNRFSKSTGKRFRREVRADRPQLARLMARLMPDDVVVVTKLDRFGRSTRELLELIERISKAGERVLSVPRRPVGGYLQLARAPAMVRHRTTRHR
jgi:hypothetical protein